MRIPSYANGNKWHRVFAWRPIKTICGTWVWLEPVDRILYMAHDVPRGSWSTARELGGWSFRLPEPV